MVLFDDHNSCQVPRAEISSAVRPFSHILLHVTFSLLSKGRPVLLCTLQHFATICSYSLYTLNCSNKAFLYFTCKLNFHFIKLYLIFHSCFLIFLYTYKVCFILLIHIFFPEMYYFANWTL